MIKKVDHIGIAVESIDAALAVYRDALGLELDDIEIVADQGVRVAKLQVGESMIELLEPHGDSSPIAGFLSKRGPGLHHICFDTDSVDEGLSRLAENGIQLIDESGRVGAGGHRVGFVHPRGACGVLVELSEEAK